MFTYMNDVLTTINAFVFHSYERLLISVKTAINSGTGSDGVIEILK